MKGFVIFFLDFQYNFPNIFNIILKSFATYGYCHPCFINVFVDRNLGDICLEPEHLEMLFSYLQRVSYDAAR